MITGENWQVAESIVSGSDRSPAICFPYFSVLHATLCVIRETIKFAMPNLKRKLKMFVRPSYNLKTRLNRN